MTAAYTAGIAAIGVLLTYLIPNFSTTDMKKDFFTNILLTRRVKQPDGSWCDGEKLCQVSLVIDLEPLFKDLGAKALGNKSKRLRAMVGAIIAQARIF